MPPPIARKWEIGSSSVRDREIALSVCQPSQRARGTEFVVVPAAGAPEARPRVAQAALPCVAHAKIAYKMNAENSRRYGVPKLRFELGFCPSFLFFSFRTTQRSRSDLDLSWNADHLLLPPQLPGRCVGIHACGDPAAGGFRPQGVGARHGGRPELRCACRDRAGAGRAVSCSRTSEPCARCAMFVSSGRGHKHLCTPCGGHASPGTYALA